MAEYIEREAARNALCELCDKYNISFGGESKGFGSELAKLPDTLPAADVRPERHGEWKHVSDDDRDEGRYFCSKCNEEFFSAGDSDDILPNFCPNCGAKMDGKDGNKNE